MLLTRCESKATLVGDQLPRLQDVVQSASRRPLLETAVLSSVGTLNNYPGVIKG